MNFSVLHIQCHSYGIMQRCWQDNPKSRCTFSQVASELQGLLAGDRGDLGADQTGRLGADQGEPSSRDSYLIPMETITLSGMDSPSSAEDSHMDTKSGKDLMESQAHYTNRSVIRYK